PDSSTESYAIHVRGITMARTQVVLIAIILSTMAGCTKPQATNHSTQPSEAASHPVVGGRCDYQSTAGHVVVERIESAPETENNCATDPVRVVLRFTPSDGASEPTTDTLTIFDGKNPPRSCLAAAGIMEGAKFPATHKQITSGTCTPSLLEPNIPALDSCRDACFTK
ncbi:MAG TPA: hypothetical protein PLV85_24700, partial [Polyangiaceae bacterium]|nr:hypothetical protein [Polyangiaceae bacterium]